MKSNRIKLALLSCLSLAYLATMLTGCGGPTGSHFQSRTQANIKKTRFTIELASYNQFDRIQLAQQLQQRAKTSLPGDDIWLDHNEQGLSVNYGHFQNHDKARRQLQLVKKYYKKLNAGQYQFCYIKIIAQPDPPAPPEWNLLYNNCHYSLEIGLYYDVPEKKYYNRKADAVQAVKNLRHDVKNAFFLHGRFQSRVYVGCFPASIKQQTYQHGKLVTTLSPFVELLIKKYPYRYENGGKIFDIIHGPNNKKIRAPRRPTLVEIDTIRHNIPF